MSVTQKWVGGTVLVALVLAAGAWFLLISPKRSEVSELQTSLQSQLDTNASLQTDVNVLQEQKKDLPQQQKKLAALRTDIPQTEAMPSLIREVNAAAAQSDVEVISVTPAPAAPVMSAEGAAPLTESGALTPGALAAVETQLVVNGNYFELMKFVNDLETLDRYMLVSNLSIAELEGADEATSGTSETDASLQATLSGRVFLLPSDELVLEATTESPTEPATASQ